MEQVVQVLGALLVLAAFLLAQAKRLRTDALTYILLNLLGSAILAVMAALDRDLGFLLLEGVWALASAVALVSRRSGRPVSPAD